MLEQIAGNGRRAGAVMALIWLAFAFGARAQSVLPAHAIPKDAQIVFASDRAHETDPWGQPANALYAATLSGKVTRITYSKFNNNHFEVSPNRRYIAVNRYSRGPKTATSANGSLAGPNAGSYFPLSDWKELWIIDTVTGAERRIAPQLDAGWGGVSWSPDSKWVYFGTPSGAAGMDIVRVNIDTEQVQVVTANLQKLLGYKGSDKRKWVSDVDVSDDGTRIVFTYHGPEEFDLPQGQGKERIGTMKVDGSEAHIITTGGALASGARGVWPVGDFDADISPDGKSIVFARVTDVGFVTPSLSTWDIMTARMDGSDVKDVSPPHSDAAEFIPSWGWSDQGKIIFTRLDAKGNMGPVVYDPRTGTRTFIHVGPGATHVQWIASGRVQCRRVTC